MKPIRFARRKLLTAAAISAVVLVGLAVWWRWPDGLERFADRDPSGAYACRTVIDWLNGERFENQTLASVTAGGFVAQSTTATIRASYLGSMDPEVPGYTSGTIHNADLAALYRACVAEGVDMPPKDGKL